MSAKTLTRSDICEQISSKIGLSRHQSIDVLESVLDGISDGLISNGSVKISSFGTFHVREKNKRIGRNPKTGQEVPIPPRKSLSFRASNTLKQNVDK